MDDDLPSEYDLIVIGTGLTESIVAASASRIGKTVLHLDSNEYYGGFWASFNFDTLQNYILQCKKNKNEAGDGKYRFLRDTFVRNAQEDWMNFEELGDVDDWNKEKILKEFRKFNVDLTPKLLYSRGALVELLISSNICRYAEFRANDRVATILNGNIMTVPSSRSDVFTNKDVNVVEKRLLMKFLSSCMTIEQNLESLENKTFLEYLKSNKLTPNLIHYILYAIAMGNDKTPCIQGLQSVKKFLTSLGRYGNTPFLFPMYGCGEIPQCFCRLCAVFGGIYCLNKELTSINFVENKFESILCGEKCLKAGNLVLGQGYVAKSVFGDEKPGEKDENKCGNLARGIFLTTTPLGGHSQNSGGGGVAFMKLPPVDNSGNDEGAFVLQLASNSGTCPKDIYLIHITCKSTTNDPKLDLKPYVDQILSQDLPKLEEDEENTTSTILYSLYFNIPECVKCENDSKNTPEGIHFACGPFFELDYDKSIEQAQKIFKTIYPEDEFLPRAPDPEEIIIGDEEEEQKVESGDECLESNEDDKVEKALECMEAIEEKSEKSEEATE